MNKKTVLSFGTAVMFLLNSAVPAFAESADTADAQTDYSDPENWAFWDCGEDKEADLFIVCPLVDMGKAGNYNADISNEETRSSFIGALNQELGLYSDVAAVYSPYYRQMTYTVLSLDEAEQEPYFQIAYDDVRSAFLYYSENCDESRPLILAGFSQGSDILIRLMTELFDDEQYSDRLVAAYAIGWSLTEEQTAQSPWLKPAQDEDDTGVIVMFNSEAEHITSSFMVGENEHTYSINPLNWKTDSTPADKSLNKGACFIDYDGTVTSEIPELTGAYIDEKRGTLKVPDISEEDYPAVIFEEGIFHIYDYQFFYRNLQENVAKRTAAYIDNKAENTDKNFSLNLEVTTDIDECYAVDEFFVTVRIENNGDGDLTNAVVYFEDTPIYAAEVLEAGRPAELRIKLMASEEDIASGGVIHISTTADELSEPVTALCAVKVLPAEQNSAEGNPATGTGDIVPLILCFASLSAAAAAKNTVLRRFILTPFSKNEKDSEIKILPDKEF